MVDYGRVAAIFARERQALFDSWRRMYIAACFIHIIYETAEIITKIARICRGPATSTFLTYRRRDGTPVRFVVAVGNVSLVRVLFSVKENFF